MKPIDPAGFEAKFQADTDPWDYATSPFEAFKRRALVLACGTRTFGRTLELACANGVTTRALAPRSLKLLAIDTSPTVIAAARAEVRNPRVTFRVARLPQQLPRGPFDLIVASEILYYLSHRDLHALLQKLRGQLARGGRVVLVHHTVAFADAAQSPARTQAAAVTFLSASMGVVLRRQYRRFNVTALQG